MSRYTMHISMLQQTRRVGVDAALKNMLDVTRLHHCDKKLLPEMDAVKKNTQKLQVQLLPNLAYACRASVRWSLPCHWSAFHCECT